MMGFSRNLSRGSHEEIPIHQVIAVLTQAEDHMGRFRFDIAVTAQRRSVKIAAGQEPEARAKCEAWCSSVQMG